METEMVDFHKFRIGYDYFTPDPGEGETFEYQHCRICREKLVLIKEKHGPTSYVEAIAGRGHAHEILYCANAGKDWHSQAYALMRAIEDTPSPTLAKLLSDDLLQLIDAKKPTKESYKGTF